MATEVDICNLALAALGDVASVTSINPPDQSAQSLHCARFYPVQRDALLEMHPWGFATRRSTASLLKTSVAPWDYSYAVPSEALNLLAVYAPGAPLAPQEFVAEASEDGAQVLYTNQPNALVHYTARVKDTTLFSPLFVNALSALLASKIAGPLIKGDAGRKAAQECLAEFKLWFKEATESDANQRRVTIKPSTPWMSAR